LRGLGELLEEALESLPSMPYDVLLLEPFAVQFRYDLRESLGEDEKAAIRESVELLGGYVLRRVLELQEV
jgi:hypothetical protein